MIKRIQAIDKRFARGRAAHDIVWIGNREPRQWQQHFAARWTSSIVCVSSLAASRWF